MLMQVHRLLGDDIRDDHDVFPIEKLIGIKFLHDREPLSLERRVEPLQCCGFDSTANLGPKLLPHAVHHLRYLGKA